MSSGWSMATLGQVLRHRKEFIQIDDLTTYRRPRVQLHAQGIVLRDQVPGALIKTKRQQVCRGGEFLVAEIDAKVGGFGILPTNLDGAIVSSHYFIFEIDDTQLDERYLGYFIRTAAFRGQVEAQGSTNYAAIRPADVLTYEIPLPPLAEQRRLVSRLDKIGCRVREAKVLRLRQQEDAHRLLAAAFGRVVAEAPWRPLREIAPLVRRPVEINSEALYPELGIRSFGKGTFHKPALTGLEIGSKRIFSIEPGDLLFSNVFAWEGAIAVAQPEDTGRFGSHRFITRVPRPELATAGFLCFFSLTDEGLELIRSASPGGAGRNRTLGLSALDEIRVPVPSIEQQRWFDALQEEMARARRMQGEVAAGFAALLPAILDRAFKGEL